MKICCILYTVKGEPQTWKVEAESEKDARLKWCAWFSDNCRIVEIR